MSQVPDLQHWTEGGEEAECVKEQLELWGHWEHAAFLSYSFATTLALTLKKGWKGSWERMSQNKPIKSIWNPCGISQSHIPETPLTSAGLSYSQLLCLFSSSLRFYLLPKLWLHFLQTHPTSWPTGTKKELENPSLAQSILVQLDFVSLLGLPKGVINKQVTSPLIQGGHFFKLKYDFISLSLISYFSAWSWNGCGLPGPLLCIAAVRLLHLSQTWYSALSSKK